MNAYAAPAQVAVPSTNGPSFMVWWHMLNSELRRLGQPDAPYGDARLYYRSGETSTAAARDITKYEAKW